MLTDIEVPYFLLSDQEKPVIHNALTSRIVETDPSLPSAIVTWDTVVATDNSGSVTLTSNFQSGDTFPIGNTNVLYTAIDQSGNVAMSSFIVTVEGN